VEDWPFGLEEIEPYYDEVEYEVGVSGQAGNVGGTIDPCGNIFEGARARAYPMPALTGTEFTEHNGSDAFNWCGGRCVPHTIVPTGSPSFPETQ
jgi:hypothetical protein